MSRRWSFVAVITALVLGGLVYVFHFTSVSTWVYGMGGGSSKYAQQWRTAFQAVSEPETAERQYPDVMVKRFESGEWVFGVDSDSHASQSGGTIVVKYSTGRVRAFFGHVCGKGFLRQLMRQPRTLAEFYDDPGWKHFEFVEYQFPPSD
jgi:hypothetical protein